jgi:FkbM family methyltransferase
MKKFLNLIARPFLGTGIGQKLPFIHTLYREIYRLTGQKVFQVSLPLNLKMWVQGKDTGPGFYFKVKGAFEPTQTNYFLKHIYANDVFFDVGAHVGYYSLLASKLVGDQGKVIAFEPSKENYQLLEKNIEVNNLRNIKIIKKAVSDKTGKTKFYLNTTSSGDNSLIKTKGTVQVQINTITLDEFIAKSKLSPNVIKVDVESAEDKVIAGMLSILDSRKLRLMFIEFGEDVQKGKKIAKLLIKKGFSLKIIDEKSDKIVNFSQSELERFITKFGFINVIAQKL